MLVHTAKLTQLIRVSREQYSQPETADQLSQSVARALTRRGDIAYLAEAAPTPPAVAPAAGLLNVAGIVSGGVLSTDLDVLVDLIAELEDNLATPSAIIVDPLGWAEVQKLKVADNYNQALLGGTTDTEQRRYPYRCTRTGG